MLCDRSAGIVASGESSDTWEMLGLQGIADVAQLVERRLPKPRRAQSGLIGRGLYSSVFADGLQGFSARSPAFTGGVVLACTPRSGVVVASRTAA